jgi:DNA-binding CsgD family transcriptional regulator
MVTPDQVTPRQAEVLDDYLLTGSIKLTAHRLGIERKTAEQHLQEARHRMGARHRIHLLVEWVIYRTGP